jgi:putative ATP-dependent DNA ligase
VEKAKILDALKEGAIQEANFEDIKYFPFLEEWKDIPRGTVVIEERVIPSYPRIARIMRIASGVPRHFKGPFLVEEKVDGYNARIAKVSGKMLAFTRSGLICPFTTDRIPDLLPTQFFNDHPQWVICAEIAGPENPYIEAHPPYVKEDVRAFVFDIIDEKGNFLPPLEKWEIIKAYQLPAVENYGVFEPQEIKRLYELLNRLNEEKREGIVLKSLDGGKRLKFVTPFANLHDIEVSSELLEELPPHFYINRLSRLIISLDELGKKCDDRLFYEAGKALLEGFEDALNKFKRQRRIYHTFSCRFRNPERAEALLRLLNRASSTIRVKKRSLIRENGFWVLTFDKVFLRSTSLLANLLRGQAVFD